MLCTVFKTLKHVGKSHNNKVWKLTASSLSSVLVLEQMKHMYTLNLLQIVLGQLRPKRYRIYIRNTNMYERLDSLNNAHMECRRNTLKPAWQDFSDLNFDICGFTSVIIVVINTFNICGFYIAFVFHAISSVTLTFTLKMNQKYFDR
jgi:hypothetical protein